MDFEFSEDQKHFMREVDDFFDANRSIDVMDVTRENMAQVADTPERREFMKKVAERGWLGITWPKEHGGQDGEGIVEAVRHDQIGRSVDVQIDRDDRLRLCRAHRRGKPTRRCSASGRRRSRRQR